MARTTKTVSDTPQLVPSQPAADAAMAGTATDSSGLSMPTLSPDAVIDLTTSAGSGEQWPVLTPPGTAGATATVSGVTGTWTSGVMCDATWSINETRNAWFHVTGGAWKKLFNGTDGAFMALCTLAAQAKQTGHQMNIREEADGMVHEIYLW
ncbi:hypothetical protein [Angustibacter peucedani]